MQQAVLRQRFGPTQAQVVAVFSTFLRAGGGTTVTVVPAYPQHQREPT
jgi:hypothetical protein